MNLIDFTKNGGYRFKQFTLRKMQEAYFHVLKAFVGFLNLPDEGYYIISGCMLSGANITAGYIYIDGELCEFTLSPGTIDTKIKKNIVTQTLGFKNGNDEQVFRFINAVTHETDGLALGSCSRLFPVFDDQYVHTDNNFDNEYKAKIDGIEPGAEVNVQTDWDITDPSDDGYFKNRPNIQNVLYSNYADLGALPSNVTSVIEFPDVGTSDYHVHCAIESLNPEGERGQDVMGWCTAAHAATSLDFMAISFSSSGVRNIRVHYTLIAN